MTKENSPLNILFWGTYDLGKPRLRILMRGLKENQTQITECHYDVWSAVEDKSQIKSIRAKLYYIIKLLISYLFLVAKFLVKKKPDLIFIGYLGHFDIIIIYPFAQLKGIPIIWDPFISLYDTIVNDRSLLSKKSILAKLLHYIESISCSCADLIILDTNSHANYFKEQYNINPNKLCSVFVGVEPELFNKKETTKHANNKIKNVLFYGQFIPLHGIETIVEAAKILENENIQFTLIGTGQKAGYIDKKINSLKLKNIKRIEWVNYDKLTDVINESDICLGIFGNSEKASRVIPNKVFQILATGKPLITMDSPAIRELIPKNLSKITLIQPANPEELSLAIKSMLGNSEEPYDNQLLLNTFTPQAIGQKILNHIYARKFKLNSSI